MSLPQLVQAGLCPTYGLCCQGQLRAAGHWFNGAATKRMRAARLPLLHLPATDAAAPVLGCCAAGPAAQRLPSHPTLLLLLPAPRRARRPPATRLRAPSSRRGRGATHLHMPDACRASPSMCWTAKA